MSGEPIGRILCARRGIPAGEIRKWQMMMASPRQNDNGFADFSEVRGTATGGVGFDADPP